MAQPLRKSESLSLHSGKVPSTPTPPETRGTERKQKPASLNQDIRAHTNRPHKGDVGRPGTNEEVFQGYKEKELK